ncbi:alpha/beta hydrolase family protein [Lysobacter niastensis]|nr:alpha/beta fold hydrolase [Lysobacter niastensis]
MPDAMQSLELEVAADDGHHWHVLARIPPAARASLLWLPALGIAARHYLPFAEALAARGVAVFIHEWRGHGSSSLRADRRHTWGYRELLTHDLPASETLIEKQVPGAPRIIGGHSLGGQLACCRLALSPNTAQQLWLVASGSPYWRVFPSPTKFWLPLAYRFLPWLARLEGALPGRRIGFGGREARGLIQDWARSGLSGRYAAEGLDIDLEAAMGALVADTRAIAFDRDWLGPESSLRFLLSKMRHAPRHVEVFHESRLGARADHYAWMKQPGAVVDRLLG